MKRRYILFSILAGVLLAGGMLFLPGRARADGETYLVNSADDNGDANIGDCVCDDGSGACTFRAAIEEANACAGGQTIHFADAYNITVATALPALTDDGTVIDASDQWSMINGVSMPSIPGVTLRGDNRAFSGLEITASRCAVRGLIIQEFGNYGIYIHGNAHQYNVIGGSQEHYRNVVGANGWNGILITGGSNRVENNYVGLNPAGRAASWGCVADWKNGRHGISVWYGNENEIIGNIVGNNGWSGITVDSAIETVILSNTIGIGADGSPAGNSAYGVHIGNGAQTIDISGNEIANNRRGILVTGGSREVQIESNTIFSNTATTLTPSYGGGIAVEGTGTSASVTDNTIQRNTAQYGGGIAFHDGAVGLVEGNSILDNTAVATVTLTAPGVFGVGGVEGGGALGAGGGLLATDAEITVVDNSFSNNTVAGDATSYVYGGGIYLSRIEALVAGNQVSANVLDGYSEHGGGIAISGEGRVLMQGNRISGNELLHDGYGDALYINNGTAVGWVSIDANRISDNTGGSTVYVAFSQHIELTNNLIVQNHDTGLYLSNNHDVITGTNNTIDHNNHNGITVENSTIRLVNTIVSHNTGYGIEFTGSPAGMTAYRNDFWMNGTLSNQTISAMQEDPLFIDSDHSLYGLLAASPCRDSGYDGEYPPASYNGLPRPQGSGVDIGAYEMPAPVYLPIISR